MKIVNNYDLIEKVNDSKGKIDLKKIIFEKIKLTLPYFFLMIGVDYIPGVKSEGIDWGNLIQWITTMLGVQVLMKLGFVFARKYSTVMSADSELLRLLVKLREAGIKTDLELLKDAKEDTVEYKFINEDARLKLRENKYILVPTNDGFGGIKDVSVLQEHNIGSKVYVLSLGSPKKYAKPVRVYN
jgi:hypothetical protein